MFYLIHNNLSIPLLRVEPIAFELLVRLLYVVLRNEQWEFSQVFPRQRYKNHIFSLIQLPKLAPTISFGNFFLLQINCVVLQW